MNPLAKLSDWNDAGLLRERLTEIRSNEFLPLRTLRIEAGIVRRLVALTGKTAEAIRADVDRDLVLEETYVV